ncbi:MAG: hypothetical protein LQ340_004838 [Diploschistes diacapsis]|nr:MAG: hypothetical protein LQ340_004838 [Diploschistes diacapsis]
MPSLPSLHQLYAFVFCISFLSLLNLGVAQSNSATSATSSSSPTSSHIGSSPSPPTTATTAASTTPAAPASPTLSILPSVSGWKYTGCYNETINDAAAGNIRALSENGNMTTSDRMTPQVCMDYCASTGRDATYAGLEYGQECWCATALNVNAAKLADASCNTPCGGQGGVACGGSWKLDVYQLSSTPNAAGKLEIGWGMAVAIVLGLVIAYAVLI